MEGLAMMDRPTTSGAAAGAPSGTHPWTGEAAAASLKRFAEKRQIEPARALVLSAGMVEEVLELSRLGCRTVALDVDAAALDRLNQSVRGNGASVDPVAADFLAMSPYLCGPVELLVDRLFVHGLEPIRWAAWIHKAGRVLPRGGRMVGFFLVGRNPDGPPYPMTLDALKKLAGRYFVTEVLEPAGSAEPGRSHAYRGLFVRK